MTEDIKDSQPITRDSVKKELDILESIYDFFTTPDKKYIDKRDLIEKIIRERSLLLRGIYDHFEKITPEESPLEKFAEMQAKEIERLRKNESIKIKELEDKIVSLKGELKVLNDLFRAYNT